MSDSSSTVLVIELWLLAVSEVLNVDQQCVLSEFVGRMRVVYSVISSGGAICSLEDACCE
jgi:hypothetical protein